MEDPNVVADPLPPYSVFTPGQKALIVVIVAVAATFSGFASNIYFPAIPTIAKDLSVTPELINLTVTSYMIFQGLSPSLWGAVADVYGRRVTYIVTFIIFFGSCIGLAELKHYYQLIILRCLQSTGSASTIAIGAGVIGDITVREERGGYLGIYQAGLLSPVAIGPILGGIFAETLGWRAIFWFLAIYSGVFLMILMLVLPETLRTIVGNGSIPPSGLGISPLFTILRRRDARNDTGSSPPPATLPPVTKKASINLLGPLQMIIGLEVTYIIAFVAIYYTVWQMIISAMSTLFTEIYDLTELQSGLCFIGNGVGCIIGTLTTGKFLDYDYRRIKKQYEGNPEAFPLERARFRTIWLWSGLECASVLVFGWTLDYNVHISVPIICTFVLGWAATSTMGVVTTFMVDIFPKHAASATATVNLARCLLGAGGTAAVLPIVNGIGVGWTFTLLVGLLLLSLVLIPLQLRFGSRRRLLREKREMDALDQ